MGKAIDPGPLTAQQRRSAAGRRILAAEPMGLTDLLTELDELRGHRTGSSDTAERPGLVSRSSDNEL